jgi:predicted RNA binding protein YcfA (HicA-like mRNA interferase family)
MRFALRLNPVVFRSYWRTTVHGQTAETFPPRRELPSLRLMKGTLNQKKAIKLLKENGWTQARGGKHQVKMTKPGCRPITLPQHKGRDYPTGLAQAILKQAELR